MDNLLLFDDKAGERNGIAEAVATKCGLALQVAEYTASDSTWPDVVMQNETKNVALIFVDHCLKDATNTERRLFDNGSSLCMAIRKKWSCVPVVGISAAAYEDVGADDRREYTDFIPLSKIGDDETIAKLKSMIDGFYLLKSFGSEIVCGHLKRLFNNSKADIELLQRIVPNEIMEGKCVDAGHLLYKWFCDVLFNYQGILVDGEMIAASIGIKFQSFLDNIAEKLESCKYSGIFAGLMGARYWRDDVFAKLAEIVEDDGEMLMSHYVDKLKKSDDDIERCFCCDKPYTELIANEEESATCTNRHAVHFKCVAPANLPSYSYFDPIYVPLEGAS